MILGPDWNSFRRIWSKPMVYLSWVLISLLPYEIGLLVYELSIEIGAFFHGKIFFVEKPRSESHWNTIYQTFTYCMRKINPFSSILYTIFRNSIIYGSRVFSLFLHFTPVFLYICDEIVNAYQGTLENTEIGTLVKKLLYRRQVGKFYQLLTKLLYTCLSFSGWMHSH